MKRDLDLKIAKEVFGWNTYEDVPPDAHGKNESKVLVPYKGYLKKICEEGYTFPNVGKLGEGHFTHTYTRDFYLAMEVVRKVQLPTPAYQLPSTPQALVELAYAHFKKQHP
jgi:hypothetical protein